MESITSVNLNSTSEHILQEKETAKQQDAACFISELHSLECETDVNVSHCKGDEDTTEDVVSVIDKYGQSSSNIQVSDKQGNMIKSGKINLKFSDVVQLRASNSDDSKNEDCVDLNNKEWKTVSNKKNQIDNNSAVNNKYSGCHLLCSLRDTDNLIN